jgi:hypothetical protein
MAAKPTDVSVLYDEPSSRPFIPVGGAIGGHSPDGSSVVAHLYVESATLPARETMERSSDGKVDPAAAKRIVRGDITRSVQATLSLAPEVAIRLGSWFVAQGKAAMEHRQRNQP